MSCGDNTSAADKQGHVHLAVVEGDDPRVSPQLVQQLDLVPETLSLHRGNVSDVHPLDGHQLVAGIQSAENLKFIAKTFSCY